MLNFFTLVRLVLVLGYDGVSVRRVRASIDAESRVHCATRCGVWCLSNAVPAERQLSHQASSIKHIFALTRPLARCAH